MYGCYHKNGIKRGNRADHQDNATLRLHFSLGEKTLRSADPRGGVHANEQKKTLKIALLARHTGSEPPVARDARFYMATGCT
jgi:hypothetical protein